ncbi:hypothetical protein [Novosphingobium sp. FSW06-99]|uniref:hypothetical protein n=1 Tax=Novosphingobium sp. FSW06-99 TaxID=1739113 RepID=UPI00076D970A|nr:hypothetical protein [Novosphingobium sp. FSW06-99]KUR80917.1 hypothetical protein AQZ49_02520 [Novosphingobium sp. FSW06-99]
MAMIENPAYAAIVSGRKITLALAQCDKDTKHELGVTLTAGEGDWLIRQGMDVMLVKDWPLPTGETERRFNTWIIRVANRELGRVTVPQHVLRAHGQYTLSRALCVPERVAAPE